MVWDTKDVKCEDWEGTSDIFIRAFFDAKKAKETDTHFRCQNGKGSFNYRMLFELENPGDNFTLSVQVWDRDIFKSNDFIGDASISLKLPIIDCTETDQQINVNKKYYDGFLKNHMGDATLDFADETSFWLEMKDKNGEYNGKVKVQVDIFPVEKAQANAVGGGRSEPNHSPFLPPPVGRLQWSLNPFKMLNQCVGPAVRRKIYCCCCLVLCLALTVFVAPMIISNLISDAINPFN